MIPEPQMPTYEDLLWPTLKALERIGGSASIQELSSQLAIDMSLPDEILDVLHKDGPQTKVFYRAAWARTHLKMVGAIDNTARGGVDHHRQRTERSERGAGPRTGAQHSRRQVQDQEGERRQGSRTRNDRRR